MKFVVDAGAGVGATRAYGGMVWVNAARPVARCPATRSRSAARADRTTYVVPSRDLVVVRMGHFPGARAGTADLQRALALLTEAIPAVATTSSR